MTTLLPNIAWRYQAACKPPGMVDVFYPPSDNFETKREKTVRESAAKAVCETCPVQAECLDHALQYGETWGVWGGKSEHELRALVKVRHKDRRRKSPHIVARR